ncbi:PAS domain-containing protein [Nostoc sp. NZL]|uniref:PAS domain-containing protein n=1 Tax=Nostoc sp. NZL TaxID=2650612 RepID=UPI0018C5513A|nr:PAS domain-containing protein [Nostoc sp. NZL]
MQFHERLISLRANEQSAEVMKINRELQQSLEELQVMSKVLLQQNEEMTVAYEIAQLERQRYQDLFKFALDGYLITNTTGSILEANHSAATLLSVHQNYLVGKPLIVFIARSDRHEFITRLNNLQHLQEWEINLQLRDSTSFPASIRVAAVYDSQDYLVGWRWLLCNISERKRAESQLRQNAFYDALTGLPNRALFIERLKHALQQAKR